MRSLATALILIAALAADALADSRLRSDLTVDAETITLGDLFENAGEAVDVRVANAPPPGERIAFNAHRLSRFAHRHGIEWRPGAATKWVWAMRASQVISRADIISQLELALIDAGAEWPIDITLRETRAGLHVATDAEPTVAVVQLDYDAQRHTFRATVVAPADSPDPVRRRISGRVYPVVEIPVLRNAVAVGDVIDEADVQMVRMRASDTRANLISDPAALIGFSPRRKLRAGQPVPTGYVQRPIVIAKGDLVTVVIETAYMHLSNTGRAKQNGSLGDIIDILNIKSHRIVQGIVEAPSRARVLPTQRFVTAAD